MKYILSKFINTVKSRQYEVFIGSCIILIAIISYNLGRINSLKQTPLVIKENSGLKAEIYNATGNQPSNNKNTASPPQTPKLDTRVVVSKNSDKYHYGWCSGAKRIRPENQIWFNSAQEAESRGYVLAGNCQ